MARINGLLLRADVHTLFDLDLIGIHPDTLVIYVNPEVRRDEYTRLEGVRLRCESERPSRIALMTRWELFTKQLPISDAASASAPKVK
jgi:hypothetical protein